MGYKPDQTSRPTATILLVSALLVACGQSDIGAPMAEHPLALPHKQPSPDPYPPELIAVTAVQQHAFDQFWHTFRSAVIADDAAAIADLADYPFELRGEMDFMPVLSLSRAELVMRMEEILAYEEIVTDLDESVSVPAMDIIRSNERVALNYAEHLRIINLEFAVVDGQWRFVRAYTDETE